MERNVYFIDLEYGDAKITFFDFQRFENSITQPFPSCNSFWKYL